ncbi:Uncharacterised protein [Kingella potus]|uniref:Uncharacterized protein n=2 Tax=Kingella potus TaxID=265175 RepID=A0A377R4N6_9NEIS|nr:hypothetical protein [Kingella potus]UOP00681.1 hypothetical protein LVJ84_12900 [Kingella potus]STR02921.1 Uncharacterised protein [Kingella potus]STR03441.1 Uncharacterised protein [Kingella potus]
METEYKIKSASQLDVAVRDALVDYIQTNRVSDLVTLKTAALSFVATLLLPALLLAVFALTKQISA